MAASVPFAAQAQVAVPLTVHSLVVEQAKDDIHAFYSNRGSELWVKNGQLDPAAQVLLKLVETARYDGLDPASLGVDELRAALDRAADGTPESLAAAELQLSRTLTAYISATLKSDPNAMVYYEHDVLRPAQPDPGSILYTAAYAPSLTDYVSQMQWMHPLYGDLRQKLIDQPGADALRGPASASLQRVRSLPGTDWPRQVLIDVVAARLYMYEGDRVVDSMKVIVGTADTQTPLMAGYLRYAVLNPYWNVPTNLVQKTISKNVLSMGLSYLRTRGYEVISEYGPDAQILDPSTIDWKAVHNGAIEVKVRQRPSATNSMGDVKFEFPNPLGIYLHDTPNLQLMKETTRQLSNGCVRLEDAERFGRWLFQGSMPAVGKEAEQRVELAEPVPIYITYLTIQEKGDTLAAGPDPYARDGRDMPALAGL